MPPVRFFRGQLSGADRGTIFTLQIIYAYEDEVGEDIVASLDFWARKPEP